MAGPPESTSPEVVAALRRCVWTDRGELRLEGWSYLPGRDHQQIAVQVYATTGGIESAWVAQVVQREDLEVNAFSSTAEDLSTTAWTATFTSSGLASTLKALPRQVRRHAGTIEFSVVVELEYGSDRHRTPLTKFTSGALRTGFRGGRSTPGDGWHRRGETTLAWFSASEGPALWPNPSSSAATTCVVSAEHRCNAAHKADTNAGCRERRGNDPGRRWRLRGAKRLQTVRIPLSEVLGPGSHAESPGPTLGATRHIRSWRITRSSGFRSGPGLRSTSPLIGVMVSESQRSIGWSRSMRSSSSTVRPAA